MNTSTTPAWHPGLEVRYAALVDTLERLIPCLEVPLHLPWIEAISVSKSPRGKSVRPIDPWKSTSPTIATFDGAWWKTTWPGVWPGH